MRDLIEATKKLLPKVHPLDAFTHDRTHKYPIEHFPKKVLPAGTSLFHGTDSKGNYDMVDGPAWFAFDHDTAEKWAGWAYTPADGRTKDHKRVLEFITTQPVELFDIEDASTYFELNFTINGDPEYPHMDFARTLIAKTGLGWFSFNEIMLPDPAAVLRPVQTSYINEALNEVEIMSGFGPKSEGWLRDQMLFLCRMNPNPVPISDVGDMMVLGTDWPLVGQDDVAFIFHDGAASPIGYAKLVNVDVRGFNNAYSVNIIYIAPSHRKASNALAFYELLLNNGVTLRSDTDQTPAGKSIWNKLSKHYPMYIYNPAKREATRTREISLAYGTNDTLICTKG